MFCPGRARDTEVRTEETVKKPPGHFAGGLFSFGLYMLRNEPIWAGGPENAV